MKANVQFKNEFAGCKPLIVNGEKIADLLKAGEGATGWYVNATMMVHGSIRGRFGYTLNELKQDIRQAIEEMDENEIIKVDFTK